MIYRIITIYLVIILWFFYWKNKNKPTKSLSKLVYNFLLPFFIFSIILDSQIDIYLFLIPVIFSIICLIVSIISKFIWKLYLNKGDSQILTYISWTLNIRTLWFGIISSLFYYDARTIQILVFILLWQMIYENILGNLLINYKNRFSFNWLLELLKQPLSYAFILWFTIIITWCKEDINSYLVANVIFLWKEVISIITVFCASFLLWIYVWKEKFEFKANIRLLFLWFIAKFILWPVMVICFILLDMNLLHYLIDTNIYKCLIIFSVMPFALNSISQVEILWINENKTSYLVLLSTFISLIILPILIYFI